MMRQAIDEEKIRRREVAAWWWKTVVIPPLRQLLAWSVHLPDSLPFFITSDAGDREAQLYVNAQ